jgi:putative sigma-54 modulation protein
MKVTVHGRSVEITDWVQQYVEKKVERLERHLPTMNEVRAEISQASTKSAADRYTTQLTITSNGQILRSEETTGDVFASIDAAVDKMARQIERFKGRVNKERRRASAAVALQSEIDSATPAAEDEETPGAILRRKQFAMHPMSEEEALEQMELLGHDFFIFFNPASKSTNVIYKRRDGNYGVLQPVLA